MSGRRVALGDLGRELRRFIREAVPELGVGIQRALTLETFRQVTEDNPRQTGKYRASHRASVDPPVFARLRGEGPFPIPGETEGARSLARLRFGLPTHLTNDAGEGDGERGYADLVEQRHHVYQSALRRLIGRGSAILRREIREAARRFR